MKKIVLVIVSVIFSISAMPQDKDSISSPTKVTGTASADVVSRYIWRGQELGDAAVQPAASVSWKGLSLGAWGSFGFLNTTDAKEFDLTLSYTTGGFNVGVTDYWFSYYGEDNNYFEYRDGQTSHIWEANIGYDFGFLNLQWYTNFAGDDGINCSGNRAYSSYFQLSAPFKLVTCDWEATVGAVPYATSFYGDADGFAVTNVALRCTKPIHIYKQFNIPIFGEFSANPSTKKAYFVAGFTIAPWG